MSNIQSIKNLPIKTVSASIDIVPLTQYQQGTNDLAKVTVNLQLQDPLQQDTQFFIPSEDLKSQKIYLPDGSKAEMGDFDPTAVDDVETLKSQTGQSLTTFFEQPTNDNLKTVVALMADYSEIRNCSKLVTVPAGLRYITMEYTKSIAVDEATGENILETSIPLPDFTLISQQGSKASLVVLMPLEITDQSKIIEGLWTPPGGAATPLERTSIAGRQALTGYWQYDPVVLIRYKY